MLAQEEEVHGKQKELDRLKEEEKTLLEDIKKSEKEIERLEQDLGIASDLAEEVRRQSCFPCARLIHTVTASQTPFTAP